MKEITIKTTGFILWDMAVSLFLVLLINIFIGIWYSNLVFNNNCSINRLKALNLITNYMELYLSERIMPNFKKNIFDISSEIRSINSNLNEFTITVSWTEKSKKNHIQLSTISLN